jgi:hypothetical protein
MVSFFERGDFSNQIIMGRWRGRGYITALYSTNYFSHIVAYIIHHFLSVMQQIKSRKLSR